MFWVEILGINDLLKIRCRVATDGRAEGVGEDAGEFFVGEGDGVALHAAGVFGFFDKDGEVGFRNVEIF